MDTSQLSDYQLYEIIQNKKLHNHIRIVANKEFNKRNISINELRDIVLRHDSNYNKEDDKNLSWPYRLLLIVFPFFLLIHVIISSRFSAGKDNKKKKEYWLCLTIGFILYSVALLVILNGFRYFN